jgi:hypothetical protein
MGDVCTMDAESATFGWTRAATAGCRFRRITAADLPLLARVYASTRTEEVAAAPWTDEQKAAFLASQFRAQHAHYQKYYPNADWLVIARDGNDIIDIALLP